MSPHGIVVNVLDSDILVSEFEPQSSYYVNLKTNTFEKCMNNLFHSYGSQLFFL